MTTPAVKKVWRRQLLHWTGKYDTFALDRVVSGLIEREIVLKQKKQGVEYFGLDIGKFIMCLFIICLHSDLHHVLNEITAYWIEKGLLRLAVPFFFTCAGFLLGIKTTPDMSQKDVKRIFLHYSKRLIRILVIFEPIAIVLTSAIYIQAGESIQSIILKEIRSIIFYPRGALWFVQASLIGSWILFFFFPEPRRKIAIPIAFLLYTFALLSNTYFRFVSDTSLGPFIEKLMFFIVTSRNGLCVGFPLMLLGFRVNASRLSFKKCLAGLVLCSILYILELKLNSGKPMKDDGSLFIMSPFLAYYIVLCLSFLIAKKNKYIMLRNLSTGLYLLHSPILNVIRIRDNLFNHKTDEIYCFCICVVTGVIICLLTYKSKSVLINRLLR